MTCSNMCSNQDEKVKALKTPAQKPTQLIRGRVHRLLPVCEVQIFLRLLEIIRMSLGNGRGMVGGWILAGVGARLGCIARCHWYSWAGGAVWFFCWRGYERSVHVYECSWIGAWGYRVPRGLNIARRICVSVPRCVMLNIEKKKAVRFVNETKKKIVAVQTMSTSVKAQFTFLVSMKCHQAPNRRTYSFLELVLETI